MLKKMLLKSALVMSFAFATPAMADTFQFLAFANGSSTATVSGGVLTALNLEITSIKDVTTGYTQTVTDYLVETAHTGSVATFELNGTLGTGAGLGITTTTTNLFSFSTDVTISGTSGNYTALFGAPTTLVSFNPGIGGFPTTPSSLTILSAPTVTTNSTGTSGAVTAESFASTNLTFSTPEPASFALFGSGLLAMGAVIAIRRKRAVVPNA